MSNTPILPEQNNPQSPELAESTAADENKADSGLLQNDLQIHSRYIGLIALVQGLVLAYLYQSVEQEIWPGKDLTWLFALVTFFISFPSLLLLIASKSDYKAIIKGLLPFTILISVLGAYTGNQQSEFPDVSSTFFVFTFVMLVACFKAIMYIKLLANRCTINYESLFFASWRNAIIFTATLLFTSIFFGILHLGAALFNLLGIELFEDLLREEWFWVPALTLASAFAIYTFRNIIHLSDNISSILQILMKFLLPLLVFVSLGFLFTLPFTGLDKLWETRSGTFLLLWLTALSLFFINAIYHKGAENKPYNLIVHRFILVGVSVLPIYSVISAYGLLTRIDQYGFTPDRLWALSIWFMLSCFTVGYLYGILKLRDDWLQLQSKVNVIMGVVVLAFTLLVSSPLLNFKAISATSQMARYYSGEIKIKELDIYYFGNNLGKPGYDALQKLKAEIADTEPEMVVLIDKEYSYLEKRAKRRNGSQIDEPKPEVEIVYWPNQEAFDVDLIAHLDEKERVIRWAELEYRLSIDLNKDGKPEFIRITEQRNYFRAMLWSRTDEGWTSTQINITVPEGKDLEYSLNNLKIELVDPKYKIIELDGIVIDVNDSRMY